MRNCLRIAFFTDTFDELNGLALTSRRFEEFARRRGLPFLCIYAAEATKHMKKGTTTAVELGRSRFAFGIDSRMHFDPLLWRHSKYAAEAVTAFQADLIHITSPGDAGQLGAYLAHSLRLPLVASWHTNLHEFAAWRLRKLLAFVPPRCRNFLSTVAQDEVLRAVIKFYKMARVLLAPNEDLVALLERTTGRLTYLMPRGVDSRLFSPARRDCHDGVFRLGFVGRLRPEKNVRFLAELEQALISAGRTNYRFLIVGEGSERSWLERHLRNADFTGLLEGEALARAYANMDLFAFPSRTETFGNVVSEALASGTPAVVTCYGGPKFLVQPGMSGHVASDNRDFVEATLSLMSDPERHTGLREAARARACAFSWERVFEGVYEAYDKCLQIKQ